MGTLFEPYRHPNGICRARPRHAAVATFAALLALITAPEAGHAQWSAELRGQMGIGGDELASIEYSDGSQSTLKMGTYFSFSAGPIVEVWSKDRHSIELQGMVGWASWATGPENTEDRLTLTRFPLDLTAFYAHRLPARDITIRFGGGAAYHIISGVSGSGGLSAIDVPVENSLGFVAETTVIFGIVSSGVRYTHMDNTIDGVLGSLNGSSVGFFLGLTLPRS